jgi:hypothetical protein
LKHSTPNKAIVSYLNNIVTGNLNNVGIFLTTHSAVYRRTWKCGNGVKDFSEQRSCIMWEQWEWETDAAGFFVGGINSKLSL